MDVVQENHGWNCMEDEFYEQSLYPEALGISDAFRDPELLPRIGEQHQVEIPEVLTMTEYLVFSQNWFHHACEKFLVGLPISLMWIKEEVENVKTEPKQILGDFNESCTRKDCRESENIRESQVFSEGDLQAETWQMGSIKEPSMFNLQEQRLCYMHQQHGGKGCCMVPESAGSTWNGLEEDSFLLGLYIFGKNLVQVKKFVGSKTMGDLLSFYYGKFYRSSSYNRWSECRKVRSRRCIFGQRIFTGSTQQQLLSRLFSHVLEQCRHTLIEIAKKFGEGKMLFEEFVFALKATVGLNSLVEAVGIGKGKQDLTGMTLEPLKSTQVARVRPEIPVGKACSMLTPLEIINFLTGGYRLSKARSNDLFWEAVWPCLLAKGWHSEQPNDHGFATGSRHSLVFLIPGIKKFSRRKLVKGDHYFDSISDVLNKIASDPTLLDLDIKADEGFGDKEENQWTDDKNLNQGEFPGPKRHCYLKPRTPSLSTDFMKFTVVDTSLATGEGNCLRELRGLPVEMMNISTSISDSEDSVADSKDATNASDSSDYLGFDQNKNGVAESTKVDVDKGYSFHENDFEINASSKPCLPTTGPGITKIPVKTSEEPEAAEYNDLQPRKSINEGRAIKRTKLGDGNLLAPVGKRRRRIAACNKAAKSCSTIDVWIGPRLKQDEASCILENPPLQKDVLSYLDPHRVKLPSTSSSSSGSPDITDECIPRLGGNLPVPEYPSEKSKSQTLIDLNIPIPQDAETEPAAMEMTERTDNQTGQPLGDSGMLKTLNLVCGSTSEQPPIMTSRRQSTRNRPLTTKALEALACGLLSTKPKRRDRDDYLLGNSISRPSRRARSQMRMAEDFASSVMDFEGDKEANGIC